MIKLKSAVALSFFPIVVFFVKADPKHAKDCNHIPVDLPDQ